MAEKQTREEKMSVIQKKLEDGVVEIFTSEKYREYMDAMSKFPRYSVNNCILSTGKSCMWISEMAERI